MKHTLRLVLCLLLLTCGAVGSRAQQRRPIDAQHPMWLIHVDVWNKADPQKIIDLIPEEVKPYVCMNLSLSCQYDTEKNVYKMPQNAVLTYKSWASVCQANNLWFTCQPASGGHTHIQDNDLATFEYFFKHYPNFLGWNYAEQFWGFDEAGDRSSSTQASRWELFANLVEMSHNYGGMLTVSFCGNIWSHPLNPNGIMKRNARLRENCQKYPEAFLLLYKYTTSSCFYNNESVCLAPFISGLAKNYGVRYDNCGWNGALDAILGNNHGKKYPVAAGIGTIMEQTCVNGGAVWDGPELIWTEDFKEINTTTVDGYTRRNWTTFPGFNNIWLDMWRKIVDGTMYIPSREEVVARNKVVIINDQSGNDQVMYAAPDDLYDGLYKQDDPFNKDDGRWMNNFCYFKKTGRYQPIPVVLGLYDDVAKSIPNQIKRTAYASRWGTQTKKVTEMNALYPEVSTGDLFVSRVDNELVTYFPYSYLNSKVRATGEIPLQYNTCATLTLDYGKLSSGIVREYSDHIDLYLNNYRTDTTTQVIDKITITGATSQPTMTYQKYVNASVTTPTVEWDETTGTYTLSLKHMGPVEVSIQCQGAATDRRTDARQPVALGLPKQPADVVCPLIIEAEDMDYKSIKSCVVDPYGWYPDVRGHAGNGFADMGTNTAGSLRAFPRIKQAGTYNIAVRYNCTKTLAKISARTNSDAAVILKPEQTDVNEWRKVTFSATLKEGVNTITLTNSSGRAMYIDNITISPDGLPAERFAVKLQQTEGGEISCDADSTYEGEEVHLTATPQQGFAFDHWEVLHGNINIVDDTFTMPDDDVIISAVFKDITLVYQLDFSTTLGGNLPQGWRAVQENGEVHEYPNSYGSGGRTFTGFTGYQGAALYWRNEYADYGAQTDYPLTLEPGYYTISYAMAAWKGTPKYMMEILDASGATIAKSTTHSAAPNANGSTTANITSSPLRKVDFRITEQGNYVIRFSNKTTSGGYTEFLLAQCQINTAIDPDGIENVGTTDHERQPQLFDLQGRRISGVTPQGIYILRSADGTTR
ncbi:MAG: glycosyl hydrolase family 98, partial [Bacteroidaceae bacterium]|nr:glycosyl hydrolase family 98 [Bacteroidaceae bacterium]